MGRRTNTPRLSTSAMPGVRISDGLGRAREKYQRGLRICGFRSWRAANDRRGKLIELDIMGKATKADVRELANLQTLSDLLINADPHCRAQSRAMNRQMRKIETALKRLKRPMNSRTPDTPSDPNKRK